jgi:hypothetical protein
MSTGQTLRKINVTIRVSSLKVLSLSRLQQIACDLLDLRHNLRIYNYTSGSSVSILNGHSSYVYSIEEVVVVVVVEIAVNEISH